MRGKVSAEMKTNISQFRDAERVTDVPRMEIYKRLCQVDSTKITSNTETVILSVLIDRLTWIWKLLDPGNITLWGQTSESYQGVCLQPIYECKTLDNGRLLVKLAKLPLILRVA